MTENSRLCSVIIPTFNEAGNIVSLLDSILTAVSTLPETTCEIFVVDDASPDGTSDRVSNYDNPSVHLLKRPHKLGIGSAYRYAFAHTSGDLIVVMDADFSHDPKALPQMIKVHTQSKDCVVFSSRYVADGSIIGWAMTRRLISRVANALARFVLWIPLTDLTSAYRVYSREVFAMIVQKSAADGFAFQVEAAFWSKYYCTATPEVGIVFRDRTKGRSKFNWREVFAFGFVLLRCFMIMLLHLY
jgi:dolichol-phosphate mannosyltransferase